MIVTIPIRVESESNLREHFAVKAKRAASQRVAVMAVLDHFDSNNPCPDFPLVVTFTRIAPRAFDDDNLARGFKAVRDSVATVFGIDDRDPRVTWRYQQRTGKRKEYGVEIHFAARGTCASCGQAVAVDGACEKGT